ncbi:hypothetical protein SAMN05444166_6690 [Singulisphaera sp. GP187]|nr:hypothetical protein SAMN05444166_6690 [Singulisphaera sp. GP187]
MILRLDFQSPIDRSSSSAMILFYTTRLQND